MDDVEFPLPEPSLKDGIQSIITYASNLDLKKDPLDTQKLDRLIAPIFSPDMKKAKKKELYNTFIDRYVDLMVETDGLNESKKTAKDYFLDKESPIGEYRHLLSQQVRHVMTKKKDIPVNQLNKTFRDIDRTRYNYHRMLEYFVKTYSLAESEFHLLCDIHKAYLGRTGVETIDVAEGIFLEKFIYTRVNGEDVKGVVQSGDIKTDYIMNIGMQIDPEELDRYEDYDKIDHDSFFGDVGYKSLLTPNGTPEKDREFAKILYLKMKKEFPHILCDFQVGFSGTSHYRYASGEFIISGGLIVVDALRKGLNPEEYIQKIAETIGKEIKEYRRLNFSEISNTEI